MSSPSTPTSELRVQSDRDANTTLKGIAFSALAYGLFSVQDATVKWLVATYAVPQILLMRSVVIIAIAFAIGGRGSFVALKRTRSKRALVARAMLILGAWLLYYTAARRLGLAEMTTIYFAAPIIAVALAALVLREQVGIARSASVGLGFLGVILAARPGGNVDPVPALMAFGAACCWGMSVILARVINRSEATTNQMVISNGIFVVACIALVWGHWRTPDPFSLALMLCLGIAGGLGQFFLFEAYRFAPASALAPVEYTGLIWAFLYGYLIWAEIPATQVFGGALLIVASSLMLIWFERRRSQAAVPAG